MCNYSENRRHVQLANQGATHAEVDVILSQKWDALSSKEKIRYFQRARDALKDENRHSTRHRQGDTSNISNSFVTLSKFYCLCHRVQKNYMLKMGLDPVSPLFVSQMKCSELAGQSK